MNWEKNSRLSSSFFSLDIPFVGVLPIRGHSSKRRCQNCQNRKDRHSVALIPIPFSAQLIPEAPDCLTLDIWPLASVVGNLSIVRIVLKFYQSQELASASAFNRILLHLGDFTMRPFIFSSVVAVMLLIAVPSQAGWTAGLAYYTPAIVPTTSYYVAPSVSYYAAPAPAVSYYTAPAVSYYTAPVTSYYTAPAVSYYTRRHLPSVTTPHPQSVTTPHR